MITQSFKDNNLVYILRQIVQFKRNTSPANMDTQARKCEFCDAVGIFRHYDDYRSLRNHIRRVHGSYQAHRRHSYQPYIIVDKPVSQRRGYGIQLRPQDYVTILPRSVKVVTLNASVYCPEGYRLQIEPTNALTHMDLFINPPETKHFYQVKVFSFNDEPVNLSKHNFIVRGNYIILY